MDSGISNALADTDKATLSNPSNPAAHSATTSAASYVSRHPQSGLLEDLEDRVHYDVHNLLEEWFGTHKVDDTFVNECVAYLRADPDEDLQTFVHELSNYTVDTYVGVDELDKKTYAPLTSICSKIENFTASNECPATVHRSDRRRYVPLTSTCNDWGCTHPGPIHDPTLLILEDIPPLRAVCVDPTSDVSHETHENPSTDSQIWQVVTFMHIKSKGSPTPPDDRKSEPATAATGQVADYARYLISTRPFQVYVLGICVFGTKFAVCYADRAGILLSPAFDYCTDAGLAVFVRVVRRMLCDLSVYDLGFDPSVTILPGQTYQQATLPQSKLSMGAQGYPGVVEFDDSGNALPPNVTGEARCIAINMRHGFVQVNYEAGTHLRRVLRTPCSRPLWTCEWKEMLAAALAAIQGHQVLSGNGILPYDISPDNVCADAGSGEGFIADLDIARALPNNTSTDICMTIQSPGLARTRSIQFMALKVLLAAQNDTSTEFSRSAQHDLESFCWVLVWSIYRKMLCDLSLSTSKDDRQPANLEFKDLFGQIEVRKIIGARNAWLRLEEDENLEITRFLPRPIANVVKAMGSAIRAQNRTQSRTPVPFLHPRLQLAQAAPEPIIPKILIDVLQGNLGRL